VPKQKVRQKTETHGDFGPARFTEPTTGVDTASGTQVTGAKVTLEHWGGGVRWGCVGQPHKLK